MKLTSKAIIFLMLSVTSNAFANGNVAVEWAPFLKAEHVSEQELLKAADKVNSEYLEKQPGFIKRELIKKDANEYADVIHWKTKREAISAGEKVTGCKSCNEYFMLMDMEKSVAAGAGFSHYETVKFWHK